MAACHCLLARLYQFAVIPAWCPGTHGQQPTAEEELQGFCIKEASNSELILTCPKHIVCKFKLQDTGRGRMLNLPH